MYRLYFAVFCRVRRHRRASLALPRNRTLYSVRMVGSVRYPLDMIALTLGSVRRSSRTTSLPPIPPGTVRSRMTASKGSFNCMAWLNEIPPLLRFKRSRRKAQIIQEFPSNFDDERLIIEKQYPARLFRLHDRPASCSFQEMLCARPRPCMQCMFYHETKNIFQKNLYHFSIFRTGGRT